MRCQRPSERHAVERKSSDALPAPAARDTNPMAERCARGPVAGKDAERIGKLGFKSLQRGKVGVAPAAGGRTRRETREG